MLLNAIERGEGPPVVFLHGLFGMARNWGAMQRAVATRFRTVALDMRNHGTSPRAPGMRYVDLANDVLDTLDALNLGPVALIGHSMGGKAAMLAALLRPEAVGRVLVSDIAPVAYSHGNTAIAAAMLSLPLNPALSRAQAVAWLADAAPDPNVRAFLVSNLALGPAPSWRIGLDEIAAGIPDLEGWEQPALPPYEGPALFVAGAESDYVRTEHRPAIRALFPRARFVGVKGAGHWVHADNPAGFLSVLEVFLHDWAA
ncbi:MAG: alpha/beta fold hydrolase [Rhodospirillales bacterium]